MRLLPRTLKGKVLAAILVPGALFFVVLILLLAYWEWMSYVLIGLFVFYGVIVALLTAGLFVYLCWRRRKVGAVWTGWRDSTDAGGPLVPPGG